MALGTETRTKIPASQRAPGRPRGFEADAVLDAALELFWKHGYRTTTTRDLESALGLSQSSLYNTFGSKKDLLEAALDRYEAMTDRELLRPMEQSSAGLAAIDTFFVDLGHWVTHEGRRGCMLINMMAEDGGETDAITIRARIYRTRVRDALRASVARAIAEGETRDIDADDCADLLLGLVLGLNIAARGGASDTELATLMDAIHAQVSGWRVAPS